MEYSKKLLTIENLMERYGVTRVCIWQWRKRGRLPQAIIQAGQSPVWRREDLDRWDAAGKPDANLHDDGIARFLEARHQIVLLLNERKIDLHTASIGTDGFRAAASGISEQEFVEGEKAFARRAGEIDPECVNNDADSYTEEAIDRLKSLFLWPWK